MDSEIKYITGSDVTDSMVLQAVLIDAAVYGKAYRGDGETCLGWRRANPDIYTVAVDSVTGEVVGYMNVMPLEDAAYESIVSGVMIDTRLRPSDIRAYEPGRSYRLYISSVTVTPRRRGEGILRGMVSAAELRFTELAGSGVVITEVSADAVSPEGERFCEGLGMTVSAITDHGSRIYIKKIH